MSGQFTWPNLSETFKWYFLSTDFLSRFWIFLLNIIGLLFSRTDLLRPKFYITMKVLKYPDKLKRNGMFNFGSTWEVPVSFPFALLMFSKMFYHFFVWLCMPKPPLDSRIVPSVFIYSIYIWMSILNSFLMFGAIFGARGIFMVLEYFKLFLYFPLISLYGSTKFL